MFETCKLVCLQCLLLKPIGLEKRLEKLADGQDAMDGEVDDCDEDEEPGDDNEEPGENIE